VKIFGAIELWKARFHYRQDAVFNASPYFAFLEQLARSYRQQGALLIQDRATYHKDGDVWAWFDANRLCLPKILSGANAFEISDIQEDETEAGLTRRIEK
jgi:hypothetical protein